MKNFVRGDKIAKIFSKARFYLRNHIFVIFFPEKLFLIRIILGLGTKGDQPAMELPGYLNRFDFDGGSTGRNGGKSNWSGSDGKFQFSVLFFRS